MQGIAEYLVRLVYELDRQTVEIRPVHDFARIEAESLQRLTGDEPPPSLDEGITDVLRHLWHLHAPVASSSRG